MLLTEKNHLKGFNGFDIEDCVVRNKDFFHFIVRNRKESQKADVFSEASVTKKEVGIYLDSGEDKRVSSSDFNGFDTLYIGATLNKDANELVLVDSVGLVYARGGGSNAVENKIPENVFRGIVRRLRMIQGRLYVVGSSNSVCYRVKVNKWQPLSLNLPEPTKKEYVALKTDDYDLVDIDGFAFDDLYTIGKKGAVWHFNGTEWESIAFPSNMIMESICCAGDGYVYISGQNGTVFKGRDNQWELIHRGEFSLPFKDMVWHAGKVWCTSDYGLWVIEKDKLSEAKLSDSMKVCAGNLSVADGVMLMAGVYGAAYHDEKQWHLIFNGFELGDSGGWEDDDNEDE